MILNYENNLKDIYFYHLSHFLSSPFYLTFTVFISVLISIPITFSISVAPVGKLIIVLIILIIFLIVMSLSLGIIVYFNFSGEKEKHKHVIELYDDYFVEKTSVNTNEYKWNSIVRIRNYKNYIIVYVTKNLAHIIPKRYFENKEDQKKFIQFIYDKAKI